jgi:hypothetical protein
VQSQLAQKAFFGKKIVTANASALIAAFSVFLALGSFFCGLRGERLPGGG